MGKVQGGYPVFGMQPEENSISFRVTGASVGATAGTDGLDSRGKVFCTASKSGSVLTVTFNRAFDEKPFVFPVPETANAGYTLAVTASGFTLSGFDRDNNGNTLADIDYAIRVVGYAGKAVAI